MSTFCVGSFLATMHSHFSAAHPYISHLTFHITNVATTFPFDGGLWSDLRCRGSFLKANQPHLDTSLPPTFNAVNSSWNPCCVYTLGLYVERGFSVSPEQLVKFYLFIYFF